MGGILMIQFDQTRCVGCGLCVEDCFPGALSLTDHKAALSAPDNCIGCGHCIAICPCNAVSEDALDMNAVVPVGEIPSAERLKMLMESRRSCRQFRQKTVPEALLQQILDAARYCPTAKNLQQTRYISVTERIPALLDAALEALGAIGEKQLKTATEPGELRRAENFIRWAAQRREDNTFDPLFFGAPQLLMFVSQEPFARDTAAGAAYAELMAAALGLGCLYSGYFTACAAGSEKIQSLLGLQPGEQVVRCLVLGYPAVKYARTVPRNPADLTRM
jgi:nitroreductase/NAD-dependent dihydropyrimidine dehydrogenase PreA subunit